MDGPTTMGTMGTRVPCWENPFGADPQKAAPRPSDVVCHTSRTKLKPVLTAQEMESLEEKVCGTKQHRQMWHHKLLSLAEQGDDDFSFFSTQLLILFLEMEFFHIAENLQAENERKLANFIFGLLNKLYTVKGLDLATVRHRVPQVSSMQSVQRLLFLRSCSFNGRLTSIF